MKRFLEIILTICLAISLVGGFFFGLFLITMGIKELANKFKRWWKKA